MWPTKGDPGYRTGNAPPMAPHPWHLNPAAYQNMSNEQVDWARLAQQWIIMKDTLPQAPPPPQLSIPRQPAPPGAPILEEEGGEAPMDISKDDNNDIDNHLGGNDSWNGNSGNNWQQSHHPPPWNNRPGYWTHKNEGGRFPPPPNNSSNFEHNRGYVSSNFDAMPSGPPHMPPFVRPRHQWEGKNMKIDRRFQNAAHNAPPIIDEDPAPVLDAAKRRTLPPWIREGLEKMEREKQKREEREKADLEREESSRRRLQEEQTALEELEAEKSGIPKRSKFETDSEDESDVKEDEEVGQEEVVVKQPVAEILARPRRRFHDGPLTEIKKPLWADKPSISREDLMLKVRRTMTEVLLEVTNCEIDSVVEETLRKVLSKASAKHQSAKTNVAIASSKTSLGLAMYGSGSEGSSSDSDDDGGAQVSGKGNFHRGRDSGDDSDGELKDIIRQRQQDFVAKEKEIEEAVAEAEEKERKSAALQASAGSESVVSAKETPNNQAVRQVETIKEQPRVDDANGKSSAKIEKTERKQRSLTRSSSSSSSSSNSSRSSRHRKRRKEKRSRHRSKDRKREKKRQRSSSSSRRSRSPRRRDSSRDRERKRRDRSRSRTRRRRSRSSESHRKTRRRSRSRSDSSRRRRRHRSSSSSSSSDRRSKKRR